MLQKDALNILKLGHTTFLTGPAGSGKSFVLREYVAYLRRHNIRYAVTASTGIASTHINGTTIHSWSGLGVKDAINKYELDAMEEKQNLYKRYNETSVVIVDEVSMLSSPFLDMFDQACKHMRRNAEPFGGLQIIFCGDFFQLPPIVKFGDVNKALAYNSHAWKESKPVTCYLTEQHRQDDDVLTKILDQIRKGDIDEFVWENLSERSSENGENSFAYDEEHIKLYTHNVDVDSINAQAYEKLEGKEKVYQMIHKGKAKLVEALKKNCLADETLRLKIGAKIICIKNDIERKYVNGSMGVVVDFESDDMPVIELTNGMRLKIKADSWKIEEEGKVKAEITQLPLRLAWAITIHKSQGMTLDRAEIDLSRAFASGMGYVALSRLRSITGLYLKGVHPNAFAISEDVMNEDILFQKKNNNAEGAIKKYDEEKLQKMFDEFILKCGGDLEERKIDDIEEEELSERKSTIILTKELLDSKKSLAEVAKIRAITVATVLGHIEKLKESGEKLDIDHLLPNKKDTKIIKDTFEELETTKLTPVFEHLKGKYEYDDLRLVRVTL